MGGIKTSNAQLGFGLTLTRAGNAIAEITDISGPSTSLKTVDVTNHGSANMYSEYIPGFKDGGDVTIMGNFYAGDTTGQVGLQTDFEARTLQSFVLTMASTSGAAWSFSAFVSKFEITNPLAKQMEFKATLKISGKPSLTLTYSTNLSNLTISAGTLVPAFSASQYNYIATESGNITVTPTNASAALITVNGTTVVSGAASGTITLTGSAVTWIYVVTQDTGKVPRVYTIMCGRN